VLIRLALGEAMPPLLIAAARLVVAALVLCPVAMRRHRADMQALRWRDWGFITLAGLCLTLHFAAWVASLQYTTVLVSVVIVSTGPIWVALMELLFFRLRLSWMVLAGLFIALAGGLLIGIPSPGAGDSVSVGADSARATGALLALTGALAISVYMLVGRKLRAKLPVIPYSWLVYTVAALVACAVMLGTGTPVAGFRVQGYLVLLVMGLVPQLIGHSSLNYLLEYFPAAMVSMFSQLEPLGSAVLAWLLFRELPPNAQIAGSGVIVLGVLVASRGEFRARARQSHAP